MPDQKVGFVPSVNYWGVDLLFRSLVVEAEDAKVNSWGREVKGLTVSGDVPLTSNGLDFQPIRGHIRNASPQKEKHEDMFFFLLENVAGSEASKNVSPGESSVMMRSSESTSEVRIFVRATPFVLTSP